MNKKTIISIVIGSFLTIGIASAQSIPQMSPWKVFGGVISPQVNSYSMQVPSLGSTGNPCVKVGSTGVFATTTCGSGGGTPANPSTSIQFNNSGSFGGTSNFTYTTNGTASGRNADNIMTVNSGQITVYGSSGVESFYMTGPDNSAHPNISYIGDSGDHIVVGRDNASEDWLYGDMAIQIHGPNDAHSGFVGMGTSTGDRKLVVVGSSTITGILGVNGTTTSPCFNNTINGACITSGGGSAILNTNPFQATYFTATSSTATSSFPIASSTCFWNGSTCLTQGLTSVFADSPLSGSGTSGSHLTISTAGTWSGNAGTATALAANGTNCSAGNFPLGVDASGNAETCTLAVSTTSSNTWAGVQTFNNASTTNISIKSSLYDSISSQGTLGMLLKSTGTSTQWVATSSLGLAGSGTVTSIATNNGLTGGTITTTGTLGLDTSGVATNGILRYNGTTLASASTLTTDGSDITFASGHGIKVPTQGNDFVVQDGTDYLARFLYTVNSNWVDSQPATFFQMGRQAENLVFASKFGNQFTRLGFLATSTTFSNTIRTGMPVPFAMMNLDNTKPAAIVLGVRGTAGQTGDLTQWRDSSNNILAEINASGQFGIGTSSMTNALTVVGNGYVSGNLTTTGTLTVGSLSGLLLGTSGVVSAVSTSSLNINSDNIVQGSTNLFWSNALFDTRLNATTSLPNVGTLAGLFSIGSSTGVTNILGKSGHASSSPAFTDSIVGTFGVATSTTVQPTVKVDSNGNLLTGNGGAPAPTISTCSTGVIDANATDEAGSIVVGVNAGICKINFGKTHAKRPFCVASRSDGTFALISASSTVTTLQFVGSGAISQETVDWICKEPI